MFLLFFFFDLVVAVFPGNVVKLADFGISRVGPFKWVEMSSPVYSLWYRAPELVIQELTDRNVTYDEKVESYALGMTMIDILVGTDQYKRGKYLKGSDLFEQFVRQIKGFRWKNFDQICSWKEIVESIVLSKVKKKDSQKRKRKSQLYEGRLKYLILSQDDDDDDEWKFLRNLSKSYVLSDNCKRLLLDLCHPNPNMRKSVQEIFMCYNYFAAVQENEKQQQNKNVQYFIESEIDTNFWQQCGEEILRHLAGSIGFEASSESLVYEILFAFLYQMPVKKKEFIRYCLSVFYVGKYSIIGVRTFA